MNEQIEYIQHASQLFRTLGTRETAKKFYVNSPHTFSVLDVVLIKIFSSRVFASSLHRMERMKPYR
jgi:hypothetical protein